MKNLLFIFVVSIFLGCSQLIVPYTLSPKIGEADLNYNGVVKTNEIKPIILFGNSGDKPVVALSNSKQNIVFNNTAFETKIASFMEVGDWVDFYKNFSTKKVEIEIVKRRTNCKLTIYYSYNDIGEYFLNKFIYEKSYYDECEPFDIEKEKQILLNLQRSK
ncbi:hypothetical protein N5915_01960 [Arcobacter lacus]|uniref:hypothetical protein n=1 Tax=Arcobacter lacus TaxID=1912876 RepID=UPI0021BBAC7D|nr:hypothetical protein [Arcobacter lacus]MCT7908313.1 hypothetical protein [Arcobacter lacus]